MKGLTPVCPYCKQFSKEVTGEAIYPHRPDLANLTFYQCKPCDAYVGCHKGGDGRQPLGRLANRELRVAKSAAHRAFDPLWKEGYFTNRGQAYAWLANRLGIAAAEDCHIGMFDVEQCRRVVGLCYEFAPELQDFA